MDERDLLLFKEHEPLARALALRYRRKIPSTVLTVDLVAAAMAGLWDAVRLRRDGGDGGARFARYASIRIRGSIVDELRAQDWLPRHYRSRMADGDQEPVHVLTGDAMDEIAGAHDVEAEASASIGAPRLAALFRFLLPRERHVVVSHYFLGKRFKDIGAELGVSEPRVSQIHAEAVGKLREKVPEDWRP